MGGSLGGSKSNSSGGSQYKSEVWDGQGDFLKDMYAQAGNLFGNQGEYTGRMNNMAGDLTGYMQQIMQGAQGGYQNQMGGGSYGDTSDMRNQLMDSMRSTAGGSQMGNMYESIVGGKGNTYIDPMVDAMKASGQQTLDTQQSSTAMDAAKMGQGGSNRHAMQNAMQANNMNTQMMDRETNMRGGAYDKDLQMKMDIARQADAGIQSTQDRLQGMMAGADRNQQGAMNAGANMQNLGMGSMAPWMQAQQSPWDAMNQYAGVLGGPTILGSGSANQSGSSKSAGGSGSMKG